jgi:phage shock protein E
MNYRLFLIGVFSLFLLSACERKVPQAQSAVHEGTPGSAIKNIEVEEAEELLQENENVVVLDVRTPKEYSEGHIAGAKNLNFNDRKNFQEQLAGLDKEQTYLVHCAVGGRSAQAREMMKELNFQNVYHLEGGFKAWEKAGKPVER